MYRQIISFLTKHKEFLFELFSTKPGLALEGDHLTEVIYKVISLMQKEYDNPLNEVPKGHMVSRSQR